MENNSEGDSLRDRGLQLVSRLYSFRDNYFVDKRVDVSCHREEAVERYLQETLEEINIMREELEMKDKASYCLIRGKALNIRTHFEPEAFELLSKAVKLNPQLTEAWNHLGECFWKKGDFEAALNCFEGGLKQDKKNKESLRSLSIMLRQVGATTQEKQSNLIRSLEKAKEAVKADVEDGMSWSVLGNAYLTMFFAGSHQEPTLIKQCRAAYGRAKRDKVASAQPDFLFNYSNLLQYEEDYQAAIDCLSTAAQMDPSWGDPNDRRLTLLSYLREVSEMIQRKGCLKGKRIQQLLNALKSDSQLGPYKDTHALKTISQIDCGRNSQTVLLVKVIGSINSNKAVCLSICVIDSENQCISVTIYNVGKGLKIGDSVAIPEPLLKTVTLDHDSCTLSFQSIRVDNPLTLMINGRPLAQDFLARPRVNNTIRND